MRWLLAGASGFLGAALRERLAAEGHQVRRLVRREPASAAEFGWKPASGDLDEAALDGVDAVVSLGGVNVFTGLWTASRREAILASRMQATGTIAQALARRAAQGHKPCLISASGVARYGTGRTARAHTEDSPAAADFLAQVTVQWEAATQPAVDAGIRVVLLRTSPVLSRQGNVGGPMRLAWSAGLGAVLGDGAQRMPMIGLEDYLGVVLWAAGNPAASGPYNLTIPEPMTNREFSDTLARVLHRPRLLRVPAPVLRAALGEMAEQLVGDMPVVPRRLLADGYSFAAPDVEALVGSQMRPG